jgi:hypothetical protein
MKRLVLLVTISFVFGVNTFGQIHKALGDKPLFSHYYTFESNNDSMAESKTIYAYSANNQLIKSITFPFYSEEEISIDSTVKVYNTNGRIVSSISYVDGMPYYSEQWIYDTVNKRIDHYVFTGTSSDSLAYTVYKGVKDFDNTHELPFLLGESVFIRDCDTILNNAYNDLTSSWIMTEIYPVYQNGKPVSVEMKTEDFDASALGMQGVIIDHLSIDFAFTYNGDKLMNVKGTLTISLMPFPISDAIVITNQYNGDDLLVETKTEINAMGAYAMGMKQKYDYNAEGNIAVMTQEISQDGTSWEVMGKIYCYYNEDNVEDLALSILNPLPQVDIVDETINIEVLLENKNYLNVYQNVKITALIEDMQGNPIVQPFTETIDQIYLGVSMLYTFSQNYIVPSDSVYYITVYIDSYL